MKRIIAPLETMGARIESKDGFPPLRITGCRNLKPISYELPVASAQVKTCLLLAGLNAVGRTEVTEPTDATRDHTERMLRWFGVTVETVSSQDNPLITHTVERLTATANFAGRDVIIPGDFSSAAFLITAASLLPGSQLDIEGVGLNPTRTQLLGLLRTFGNIETAEAREVCNEMHGTLRIRAAEPASAITVDRLVPDSAVRIGGQLSAALIDELPLVAVIGTQLSGGLSIRDAKELRFKETDRIAATVANLRAMGAEVEEFEDGLMTKGPVRLHGAKLDSYGDHRIAMAFTVAALLAEGESELAGSECVAISFPEFFECLESVVER